MKTKAEPISGEGETYLALLTANVLRLRRQWELAEAKCSEVLQRDPQSAAACSVMGDITRDQGRLRDAIEWYKMALDRNPRSTGDRRKLEALIDQVFAARPEGVAKKAASAVSRGVSSAIADVRSARPPGPLALIVSAVLLVIFVVALSTVIVGRRGQTGPPPTKWQMAPGSFAAVTEAHPQRKPVEAPPVIPEAPPNLLAREPELLDRLNVEARQMDPNCKVDSVEIDPRNASVDVHFSMPRMWPPAAMRESIIRAVGFLVSAVEGWDERVPRVRARCVLRGPGGPEQVAVVAEGTREQLAKLHGASPRDTERLLAPIWWAPELREQ